ncbi:DNA ligase [Ochrobactrum phage vB_OspM_OC]|nr:DNA ligase [Ochrobactrum phage vB_OspM_OC]
MIYSKKPLFKRNVNGKIQIWFKNIDGSKHQTVTRNADFTEDGTLIEGKAVFSEWKDAKPKNVGKKNETTGEQQAILEVEAEYEKRLKVGYTDDLDEVDNVTFNDPMLAQEYEKRKGKLKSNATYYSQPKLDGIRCIITRNGMRSRENREFISCPHILKNLKPFFDKFPDAVLDGELYNHSLHDDFNEIVSLVRETKDLTPEQLARTAAIIEYHVYDIFSGDPYIDRISFLTANIGMRYNMIQIVPTVGVRLNEFDIMLEKYVEMGYEGQIIRIDGVGYESGKRSNNLIKHKTFDTNEFKILDISNGEGNRKNVAGFITCELPDGRTFKAGIKGSFEYAAKLLETKNKYIGGVATIRHFKYTPYGIPRFPVLVAVFEHERDM